VKKVLPVKGTSLGSLSEASSIFEADLIAPLIKELAKKSIPLEKDPKLKSLEFDILKSIPLNAKITDGNFNEKLY